MLLPLRLEMGPRCSNHLGLFVDAPLSRPDFPIARELISTKDSAKAIPKYFSSNTLRPITFSACISLWKTGPRVDVLDENIGKY
jgi:hypothetical protein